MKRRMFIFLLLLCLAVPGMSAMADTRQGETVTVTIFFSSSEAVIARVGFDFDHNALEFVSAAGGVAPNNDKGYFIFGNSVSPIGALNASITFRVKADALPGTYPVDLSLVECYRADGTTATATMLLKDVVVTCLHKNAVWQVTRQPDCLHEGVEERLCAVCGASLETRATGTKGEHLLPGRYTLLRAATCGRDGEEGRSCTVCGETVDIRAIPATGLHVPVSLPSLHATENSFGLSAGVQCQNCGLLLVPQLVTPPIETVRVLYVPENVTVLKAEAFYGTAAVRIVLPQSLQAVEKGVFAACTALNQVQFLAEDVTFDVLSLEGIDLEKVFFYAPQGSLTAERLAALGAIVTEE